MMTPIASKFDPDFLTYLQDHMQEQVAVIVRCEKLDPHFEAEVTALGLIVHRRLRLIRGLAVEGRASSLLALAQSAWVLRIEPDQFVHTMP